jgi:hypothetical protein
MPPLAPLPPWIENVLAGAPAYVTKRELAAIISNLFGPISYRTIETRPFIWKIYNGKAVTSTRGAIISEYNKFLNSPSYRVARTKPPVDQDSDASEAVATASDAP